MMRIAIIGATGKAGSCILREALLRGFDVVPLVRNANKLNNDSIDFIEKDAFDLSTEDLSGFDVIVNAFKAPIGQEEQHIAIGELLMDALTGTKTRYIVVGGAGSLFLDKDETSRWKDHADYPKEKRASANAQTQDLERLQAAKDLQWTFISPSAIFDPEGTRTGQYTIGKDRLLYNEAGESYISTADYAIAVVDEIEENRHPNRRFTVCAERL